MDVSDWGQSYSYVYRLAVEEISEKSQKTVKKHQHSADSIAYGNTDSTCSPARRGSF